MKKISTLKKKIALLLALLMGLSAVPAAIAVSQDWAMLTITLEWNDQDHRLCQQILFTMHPAVSGRIFRHRFLPEQ